MLTVTPQPLDALLAFNRLYIAIFCRDWSVSVVDVRVKKIMVKKSVGTTERRRDEAKDLTGVGFEPTPGRPDCDLNAAP